MKEFETLLRIHGKNEYSKIQNTSCLVHLRHVGSDVFLS